MHQADTDLAKCEWLLCSAAGLKAMAEMFAAAKQSQRVSLRVRQTATVARVGCCQTALQIMQLAGKGGRASPSLADPQGPTWVLDGLQALSICLPQLDCVVLGGCGNYRATLHRGACHIVDDLCVAHEL